MRRYLAVVKSTALEILSEPLTLLFLLAALVLTVVMPVFHYHQFGEATRMARDAGLSALFTCGGALAVFATIRTFRRELETGTYEMALAHALSRSGFYLAKMCGAFAAYLVFALIVGAALTTSVTGAAVGGRLAERSGDLARIWGPCVAAGVATLVLPLIVGAALNRFVRCRFVLSTVVSMLAVALASAIFFGVWVGDAGLLRLMPAVVLLVALSGLWVSAAAAASVRLKANAAASLMGLVVVLMLPFLGNYYRANALANGATLAWSYVGLATLALVPAVAGFLILGTRLCRGMD